MRGFHVGAAVRLKARVARSIKLTGARQVTTVRAHIADVIGGVWLDDALGGFRAWNINDLEPVRYRPERGDYVTIKTSPR